MKDVKENSSNNLNNSEIDNSDNVEESLRDFISNIVVYFEKFKIEDVRLSVYEGMIFKSQTLLQVFDVMKDMFEDLMQGILVKQKS